MRYNTCLEIDSWCTLILYFVNDSKSIYVSLENTDECLYLNMDIDVSLVGKSMPEKNKATLLGKLESHTVYLLLSFMSYRIHTGVNRIKLVSSYTGCLYLNEARPDTLVKNWWEWGLEFNVIPQIYLDLTLLSK